MSVVAVHQAFPVEADRALEAAIAQADASDLTAKKLTELYAPTSKYILAIVRSL